MQLEEINKAACQRLLIIMLALAAWPVFCPRAPAAPAGQLPLLDGEDLIIVPVRAFNQSLNFIVDTGFTLSAVDSRYASYLGPQLDAYTAVSSLGTKNDVPVYRCPDISVGGKPVDLPKIIMLDLTMLNSITGVRCDGILGADWLAKNVVSVNFDDNTLAVEAAVPPDVRKTFVPVAVTPSDGLYTMKATVNGNKVLDLVIDTGDSSSLSLNPDSRREVFSGREMKSAGVTVADAVKNVAQTKVVVAGEVAVAGLRYTNLHAIYIRNPRHPSRLGLHFFQRHNVIFDFPDALIYLQPNRHRAAPDVEDMSGLHLLRQEEKTVVFAVDESSPAAAQGIASNDVITAVNQRPASGLSVQAIREALRAGDGEPVELQVKRGDKILTFRIVLRKTI